MDNSLPGYCVDHHSDDRPHSVKYTFYVNEVPHEEWVGYACWSWTQTTKIVGYFFGGFDTTERTASLTVAPSDCFKMAEFNTCDGNPIIINDDASGASFRAFPEGQGTWMQTKIFSVINYEVKRITLTKDCPTCPVMSPFGTLTNDSSVGFVTRHHTTIVWKQPHSRKNPACMLRVVHNGTGIISMEDDHSRKLSDHSGQLDFIYSTSGVTTCNRTVYPLLNHRARYIELLSDTTTQPISIRNLYTRMCLAVLNSSTFTLRPCRSDSSQLMEIDATAAIRLRDPNICFGISHPRQPSHFDILPLDGMACHNATIFRFNALTHKIKWGRLCLSAISNGSSLSLVSCTSDPSQQWIAFNISLQRDALEKSTTDEASDALELQHRQHMEDQSTVRENELLRRLKEVDCSTLLTKSYSTLLLAQQNGIAAASAQNFPVCHRLKPIGPHFIIQKCKPVNISIGAKQTSCGHEPFYRNHTIGLDGYSFHDFQECFWSNNFAHLNGKTYTWNNTHWIPVQANFHLPTIQLSQRFQDIPDDGEKYLSHHHVAHERLELGQLNIVNDLAARVQSDNVGSLQHIVMAEHSYSNFGDLSSWITSSKTGLLMAFGLIFVLVATTVAYKLRLLCCHVSTHRHSHTTPVLAGPHEHRWEDCCPIPNLADSSFSPPASDSPQQQLSTNNS